MLLHYSSIVSDVLPQLYTHLFTHNQSYHDPQNHVRHYYKFTSNLSPTHTFPQLEVWLLHQFPNLNEIHLLWKKKLVSVHFLEVLHCILMGLLCISKFKIYKCFTMTPCFISFFIFLSLCSRSFRILYHLGHKYRIRMLPDQGNQLAICLFGLQIPPF